MDDTKRGLYDKYRVDRVDGSNESGEKHAACWYYVLDPEHDEYAVTALLAYATVCRDKYPHLAAEITTKVGTHLRIKGELERLAREREGQ